MSSKTGCPPTLIVTVITQNAHYILFSRRGDVLFLIARRECRTFVATHPHEQKGPFVRAENVSGSFQQSDPHLPNVSAKYARSLEEIARAA